MKTRLSSLLVSLWILIPGKVSSLSLETISGPPGSGAFGFSVVSLPNGNFVVADPIYEVPGSGVPEVGAVYLYSKEGQLINRITGSTSRGYAPNEERGI
jgi:hypothetical protein